MATQLNSSSHSSTSTFSVGSQLNDKEGITLSRESVPEGLSSSQFRDKVASSSKSLLRSATEMNLSNRVQSLSCSERELIKKQYHRLDTSITTRREYEEQGSFHATFIVSVGKSAISTKRIDTIREGDLRISFQDREETWIGYFDNTYRFFTEFEGEYVIAIDPRRHELLVNGPSGLVTPDLIPSDIIVRDRKKAEPNSSSPLPDKASTSKLPSSHHSMRKKERGHKQREDVLKEKIPTLISRYKPLVFDVGVDGEIDIELFHIFTRGVDPCLGVEERDKSLTVFYGTTVSTRRAFKLNTTYRGRYFVQGNLRTGELQVTLPGGAIQILR